MFWKKDNAPILVEYQSENVRNAYRLTPHPHTPIVLLVAGERVQLCNISSTGVAFSPVEGHKLDIGEDHCVQAVLFLDGKRKHPIPLLLEVLDQHDSQYRCGIKTYSLQGEKALCRYLIKHQKREIREQRQAKAAAVEIPVDPDAPA